MTPSRHNRRLFAVLAAAEVGNQCLTKSAPGAALRSRVARFIETQGPAAGQADACSDPPSLGAEGLTGHTSGVQFLHRAFDIIAHQVKLVPIVLLGWMHRRLRGRQAEDQPGPTSRWGNPSASLSRARSASASLE